MPFKRLLAATRTHIYICDESEVIQTINAALEEDPLRYTIKMNKGLLVFTEQMAITYYGEEGSECHYA
jgi:hypothetical protein